ncbi:MAG: tol-pal system protein YbgF [Thiohalomonadales bacterium]
MLNKITINFLCYLFSGLLVLITISANVSAAPRRPVYSSSDNNDSSSKTELQESQDTIENRLVRLERLLESQSLVDLLVRIDNIQVELQSMRGDIEVINHSIDEIKRRQRDLYIDVDRRLVQLERAGKGSSVSSNGAGKTTAQSNAIMAALGSKSTSVTSPESTAEEQKQYQQAFNLLRELRYDKSIKAFNKFIETYPKGRYAHIAQYWVGEANYAQRNFKLAIEAYQSLISNYPKSPKVAESLLKIGYSYYELNEITNAKSNLNKLVKLYPDTTEASQAKNKLQKIKLNSSKK